MMCNAVGLTVRVTEYDNRYERLLLRPRKDNSLPDAVRDFSRFGFTDVLFPDGSSTPAD